MAKEEPKAVLLSDLSAFGDLIPPGIEFVAKATKIDAKSTKANEDGTGGGKPYLSISFSILNGDHEGLEATKAYFLSITKSGKNGKLYGKGVSELCSDLNAIGKPLPKDYPFKMAPTLADVQALSKLVAERVKPSVTPRIKFKTVAEGVQKKVKDVNGNDAWVDDFNDDGTKKTRTKYLIIGAGAASAFAEPKMQNPLGEGPDEGATSPEVDEQDAVNLL